MTKPFSEVLAEMQAMHDRKSQGYGSADDPYANVKASAELGVQPWVGALLRLNDHLTRIKQHLTRGTLTLEDIRKNDLIDIATYGAIALALFDEDHPEYVPQPAKKSIGQMVGEAHLRTMAQRWDEIGAKALATEHERIQHYPSKVAEALASRQVDPSYNCMGMCTDCTCTPDPAELCICGAGGVDIDCEAHGDIRCEAKYYHLGEDRVCELRANHDGPHENWHTAAIHGTPPLQWAGKPEPVRAS
jgi:hypothetical protein